MKELSIEEKAKAYDEALKVLHKYDGANIMFSQDLKEEMFPELAESEDERIRKEILTAFSSGHDNSDIYGHGITYGQVRAWLEKQGEQRFEEVDNLHNYLYGEQKSSWSEEDEERLQSCLNILQAKGIVGITETVNSKWLKSLKNRVYPKQEWSEEDEAKDNWELVHEFVNKFRRIPKDEDELNVLVEYVLKRQKSADIIPQDFEKYVEHLLSLSDGEGHGSPAKLKEMCSKLLRLAKLQQNPTWGEEDEKMLNLIIAVFEVNHPNEYFKANELNDPNMRVVYTEEIVTWLKTIKGRVQPQPKQEWSEEEKARIDKIVDVLDWAEEKGYIRYSDWEDYVCYVKSLRPQNTWKPSDEQMEILKELVEDSNQRYFYTILKSLYEQLKNLRDG